MDVRRRRVLVSMAHVTQATVSTLVTNIMTSTEESKFVRALDSCSHLKLSLTLSNVQIDTKQRAIPLCGILVRSEHLDPFSSLFWINQRLCLFSTEPCWQIKFCRVVQFAHFYRQIPAQSMEVMQLKVKVKVKVSLCEQPTKQKFCFWPLLQKLSPKAEQLKGMILRCQTGTRGATSVCTYVYNIL